MNIFLFLSLLFLFTFLIGMLLEKIRIPWVFSALLLGMGMSLWNPFSATTSSEFFQTISQWGMYFLLFVIGLDMDMKGLKKQMGFIANSTMIIIFISTVLSAVAIELIFKTGWVLSSLLALSLATVGEAILIPILDEFKLTNSPLGQSIIGIGTFDDIIEVALLLVVGLMVGTSTDFQSWLMQSAFTLGGLLALFILTSLFILLRSQGKTFRIKPIETLFLFSLFVLFLFIGVGEISDSAPLAAILAGIALRSFLPASRMEGIEKEVKTMSYGMFTPLFFFSVGLSLNLPYMWNNFPLVLLVIIIATVAKLIGTFVAAGKKLGWKCTLTLGIGLSVRFSTGIIVLKILYDSGLISENIFTLLTAASAATSFIVPLFFSQVVNKWSSTLLSSKQLT